MKTVAAHRVIVFKHDFAAREDVIEWWFDAEARGLTFRVLDDGRLGVGPRRRLTAEDNAFLHAHRDDLLAAVVYRNRIVAENALAAGVSSSSSNIPSRVRVEERFKKPLQPLQETSAEVAK